MIKRGVPLALALLACSMAGRDGARSPDASEADWWDYDVTATDGGRELAVRASFPPGTASELGIDARASRFVTELEVASGPRWERAAQRGESWVVPCDDGCRVRYRFMLADAARAIDDIDVAKAYGAMFEAAPSTWLAHPGLAGKNTRYRLRVHTPPGTEFVSGTDRASDGAGYEASALYLPVAPYAAFGALRTFHAAGVRGVDVEVSVPADTGAELEASYRRWIADAARAVSRYFGCFPRDHVTLVVAPVDGRAVRRGHALGDGGASIVVEVGERATKDAFAEDWVLTHEFVHIGFPSVSHRQHWMEEGVAVYVEPLARLRAGLVSLDSVWSDFARGFPKGLPGPEDRGLDNTHTWARTYWGGALFCLLADIEIRERTRHRYTLADALRGIVAAGGNISVIWGFDRALAAGDRAVGVPVLEEMYARFGDQPVRVDVDALLRRLGVVIRGDQVSFDDAAPLAGVRQAITPSSFNEGPAAAVCAPPSPELLVRDP